MVERFVFLSILMLLIFIGKEDWESREINIYLLLLLIFAAVLNSILNIDLTIGSFFFGVNFGFLVFQLLLVTIYFSIKTGKLVWLPDNYLGWGDIVFMIAVCWLFAPGWFLIFYTFSLIFSLVCALILNFGKKNSLETIPLATGLSLTLFFTLILGKILNLNFYKFDFTMLDFL